MKVSPFRGSFVKNFLGGKAVAVFPRQGLAALDERRRAQRVDHGDRAAGIRSKSPAENGTHIGIARIGDDAVLETARRFERLDGQKPQLQLAWIGIGAPSPGRAVEKSRP